MLMGAPSPHFMTPKNGEGRAVASVIDMERAAGVRWCRNER